MDRDTEILDVLYCHTLDGERETVVASRLFTSTGPEVKEQGDQENQCRAAH